jgi:hypothetical protein
LLQELLSVDGPAIIRRVVKAAKAGDPVALKLCIDRLVPRAVDRVVTFDLPAVRNAADVAAAVDSVIVAAAAGELSLEEAGCFIALLDAQRKALETQDLQIRIEVLESDAAQKAAAERTKRRNRL